MSPIPREAADQFGLFTREQAERSGWSTSALTRASRSGRLSRVRNGVFLDPEFRAAPRDEPFDVAPPEVLARRQQLKLLGAAAALKVDRGVVSNQAAALMHGLPLFGPTAVKPCLILPPGIRIIETHTHLHRIALKSSQITTRGAIALTTAGRTCLDIAREFGLTAGLVAADCASRLGLTDQAELEAIYHTMRGRGGSPDARQVTELLDGRHESVLETISALAMGTLAVQPAPQVTLRSPNGQFVARCDFYWEALGLVGEADGQSKYRGEALYEEKLREDRLRALGLHVVRWTFADALDSRRLLAKLRHGFYQAGLLRNAGIPIQAIPHFAAKRPGLID